MTGDREHDKLMKIMMVVGMIIVILLFLYVAKNIYYVSKSPCEVCTERYPQVWCFPMINGTLEPADWPSWLQPVGPRETS